MDKTKKLLQAIQSRGLRLTRQRRLVFEILEECQEHFDAETLYIRAKARDPKISLATVYRSLAFLKEAGLVEEHRLGEDHAHFETIHKKPHYHFTCLGCGKVIELEASQLAKTISKLCQSKGIQITEVNLHLGGYCQECQAKESEMKTRPAA